MQIDFGYLSNLEELTINNCAQFDDAFIYDYKDFVNIMGNFVKGWSFFDDRMPLAELYYCYLRHSRFNVLDA